MSINNLYIEMISSILFLSSMGIIEEIQPSPETLDYSVKESSTILPYEREGGLAVLEAQKTTVLSSQIRSTIIKIYKKMGDKFQEGDVLIELDNREYSIQFMRANALYKKNSALYASKKKLYSHNIVSLSELIEAESNKDVAKADLDQAAFNLQNTVITAPYSGKVKRLFLEEKELARVGSELIEIISDDRLISHILLPSSFLGDIQLGDKMIITLDEYSIPIEANVERISQVIDPASATIKVEAVIENKEKKLKSGMSGWAVPKLKQKEDIYGK